MSQVSAAAQINELVASVFSANSLEEVRDALQELHAAHRELVASGEYVAPEDVLVNANEIPVFGSTEPTHIDLPLWSYDESRALVGVSWDSLKIVEFSL